MTARILVLEGPDGCGKSTHADRLAAALRAEGVDAQAFHHAKPATADVVLAALDYAAQRWRLVIAPPAAVIVADRWTPSSWALGLALADHTDTLRVGGFLRYLAIAEDELRDRLDGVHLTAPQEVLDARLAARGTHATQRDYSIRQAYRLWARHGVHTLDTSRPADDVAAELLAWARGVLR